MPKLLDFEKLFLGALWVSAGLVLAYILSFTGYPLNLGPNGIKAILIGLTLCAVLMMWATYAPFIYWYQEKRMKAPAGIFTALLLAGVIIWFVKVAWVALTADVNHLDARPIRFVQDQLWWIAIIWCVALVWYIFRERDRLLWALEEV